MKFKIVLFLLLININLYSQVENGFIDLTGWNFKTNPPISLSGNWLIENSSGDKFIGKVPGDWGESIGTGIFTVNVISSGAKDIIFYTSLITSEAKITHNGKLILTDKLKRGHYIPVNLEVGDNIFRIEVSNFLDTESGIRNNPYIGSADSVRLLYEKSVFQDIFSSGSSFIIFILFLSLFLYYPSDKSPLYISFICFCIFVRGFVTNDKMIYLFLDFPLWLVNRIEYASIYFLPLLFLLFCRDFFRSRLFEKMYSPLVFLGVVFGFSTVVLPSRVYFLMYYPFLIYVLVVILYLNIKLFYLSVKKVDDAFRIFISVLTLTLASVYDIWIVFQGSLDRMILSRVIIIFILLMAYIVSFRQLRNIKIISQLSNNNFQVNKYFSKFVPKEFIKTIGSSSVVQVENGEGIKKEMTILFSSIHDFYKTSKLLSGSEVIDLLNRCYSVISPIIIKYGGFVDKFMDETIMAIFPNSPLDAVNACLEISTALNKDNVGKDIKLKMLSGIHFGDIFLGIVGDNTRVDATIVSKAVNTASRISTFTKKIDKEILISEKVYKTLDKECRNCNYMGKIQLKGYEESIGIYSVNTEKDNSRPASEKEADNLFSISMRKLEKSSLSRIEHVLLNIKKVYYYHKPTLYYLKLIKENKKLKDLEK